MSMNPNAFKLITIPYSTKEIFILTLIINKITSKLLIISYPYLNLVILVDQNHIR